VERLCALCAALHPQAASECALAAQRARQLEADGVCCRVSQLAVNGRDLMAAGIPAGPALRRVLEALLDLCLDWSHHRLWHCGGGDGGAGLHLGCGGLRGGAAGCGGKNDKREIIMPRKTLFAAENAGVLTSGLCCGSIILLL